MKIHLAAVLSAFALAASFGAEAQTVVKLRLAHELPITNYGHVYIDRWAKLVKEASKGEIEINVFPAGQLYKDADAVQALSTGGLDMQLAVASYLSVVRKRASSIFRISRRRRTSCPSCSTRPSRSAPTSTRGRRRKGSTSWRGGRRAT